MCTDVQLSQLVQLTNGADSQVAQVVVVYVRENITEVEVWSVPAGSWRAAGSAHLRF
jgi:hypothetical protein